MAVLLAFGACAVSLLVSCQQAGSATGTPAGRRALGMLLKQRAERMSQVARGQVLQALIEVEEAHGIDAILLLAVIEQESHYRVRARSPRGARGLMQVRPATGRDVASRMGIEWGGPDTLYDPTANIRIGAAYLSELKGSLESWDLTLAAYNLGPRGLDRMQARGTLRSSKYSRRVMERYEHLRRAFLEHLGHALPG
jgi:soluble lytic murein transglycosylase-like protein